ncbi:hypothetical protein BGZ95_000404, partial [Linnemannia exigua]
MLAAASASSVASQNQHECLCKKNSDSSGGDGADGNGMQCDDDLPSPDYINLTNSHSSSHTTITTSTTDRPRAPHTVVSSTDSVTTQEDEVVTVIPSITILHTIPQQHYLTPELVAMENGIDPSRLFLSTVTPDNAGSGGDRTRRLDTPLLDLQEQGYATIVNSSSSSSPSTSSPGLLSGEVENRHAELSIVTKGPGSGGPGSTGECKKVVESEVEEGPALPLSADLDRRYWQLAESVDDIELLQQQHQQAITTATLISNNNDDDGDGDSSDAGSDDGQSQEEYESEEEVTTNSTASPSGLRRKRVRFMKEIQIIPSSRMSSDDDDDLTLIGDSEEEDEPGDDGDNVDNSCDRRATFCDIATTITTDSEEPTLFSERKVLKVVESILALEEQQQLVVDAKEEISKDNHTPTPAASDATVLPS